MSVLAIQLVLNNSAIPGGAIVVDSGNISSTNDYYINNSTNIGGAIYVYTLAISLVLVIST